MPGGLAPAPFTQAPSTHASRNGAPSFVTGAYQASGDPAIDRMIRLEAACKRFAR